MNHILPFVVSGLVAGAVYGLAGAGLVLTYKTSNVFNFAHGALGTVAAYFFYWLHIEHGLDWKWSMILSVVVLGGVLGLIMEFVGRNLAKQPTYLKVVGTIGIVLLVQSLATLRYGTESLTVPRFLPGSKHLTRVLGVNIRGDQILVTAVAIVAVAVLYAFFRRSRLGTAMRAVVDDPELLAARGINPNAVRRVSWVIGSTFAALSGVLIMPLIGLNPTGLTLLVVAASGAAAFGSFSSIPLALCGGLVIGVSADVLRKYVISFPSLAGLPGSVPFIVLYLVILILASKTLGTPSFSRLARPSLQWRGNGRLRSGTGALVIAALAIVPVVESAKLLLYTRSLTLVILLLSLALLVKTSGQVSLSQVAFAAIGATTFSHLRVGSGIPWGFALLLAGAMCIPVGALVSIATTRLSGFILALATLAFGIMVEQLFYPTDLLFSRNLAGRVMPRPSFAETDTKFYYLVLAFTAVVAVGLIALKRARLGRMLDGMSGSPTAVLTMGLSTAVTRVVVFCLSAFLAGIAGALYGSTVGRISLGDPYFRSFSSLLLVAALAVAPFAETWAALIAGMAFVIPAYLSANGTYWLNAIFGFFALVVALRGGQAPMPDAVRKLLRRFEARDSLHVAAYEAAEPEAVAGRSIPAISNSGRTGLEVRNLTVRFGGLVAVRDLSFQVPMERITGLIGPNGAGKTTTFNACSGLIRKSDGHVALHASDVTRLSSATRARRGLGRTFQRFELADSMTVSQNVALGFECALAGASPLSQLTASKTDTRRMRHAVADALNLCGIEDLSGRQVGALSTGERRLVELARCLAGSFDVLLLDEPSSGLDPGESHALGETLRYAVQARGCGVLLVEHDMALVMSVCDYIYVLDFGELLFKGTPQEVAASPIVRAAYLGEEIHASEPDMINDETSETVDLA